MLDQLTKLMAACATLIGAIAGLLAAIAKLRGPSEVATRSKSNRSKATSSTVSPDGRRLVPVRPGSIEDIGVLRYAGRSLFVMAVVFLFTFAFLFVYGLFE